MIPRYARPQMAELWSEKRKFEILLEIEILACEAQAQIGVIPKEAALGIRKKPGFDLKRIEATERVPSAAQIPA